MILLCAEAFAEALVATGEAVGISEFLLVQWLAPLASEAPELLVAGLFAWRLNTNAGLGTLVSSKVNQWTLLVGTLPIVFAIASGILHGLPIDAVQREELFLTAAQSFFAIAVLINLRMSLREAGSCSGCSGSSSSSARWSPRACTGSNGSRSASLYLVLGVWQLLATAVRGPAAAARRLPRAATTSSGAAQLAESAE